MSKNFELLQRVARDVYFSVPDVSPEPPKRLPPTISLKREPPEAGIVKLAQRLFTLADKESSINIVTFSGITREDRSSQICAQAAEALADQSEGSVCAVDANFSTPQLHIHLGIENQAGLAEALTIQGRIREFAARLPGRNLWLLPAGHAKPGFYPSEERYRDRFNELREEFNFVLISAPALQGETDLTRIAQLTDGVVLIVEANHSRREVVRRAKEHLESTKVKLIGAVLDQRTFPIPEKLYRKL